jgi:hypothetical protein
MIEEIWRDVKGYEGYYKVSSFGNVISIPRNGTKKEASLRIPCNGRRYKHLNLAKNGVNKTRTIHILVAEAFLGYDSKNKLGLVVDHVDNNPHNNRLDNLQIVTHRVNASKDSIGESGLTGVSWHKPLQKWRAQICIQGKKTHLGYFDCKFLAHNKYKSTLKETV